MKSEKILEMLRNGEYKELEQIIAEEVYISALSSGAKKRLSAAKKFFKFAFKGCKEVMAKPYRITYHGEKVISFCDGYCIALTRENLDGIGTKENAEDEYLKAESIVTPEKAISSEAVNIADVIARAKIQGYTYTKENQNIAHYVWKYKEVYYNIALLDKAFSIIDNGDIPTAHYIAPRAMLHITNDLGVAGVLPLRCLPEDVAVTVIE